MPFRPGQSGNKSGRPPGFAGLPAKLRDLTNNGDDLLKAAVEIALDKSQPARDRMMAIAWCGERMWGKAPQTIELRQVDDRPPLADLTPLPLDKRRELLAAADVLDTLAEDQPPDVSGMSGDVIDVQ